MMSFKKKITRWVKNRQADIARGQEISMQIRDERERRKQKRYENMKPSAVKTLWWGVRANASPMEVMKSEWNRRRHNRGK